MRSLYSLRFWYLCTLDLTRERRKRFVYASVPKKRPMSQSRPHDRTVCTTAQPHCTRNAIHFLRYAAWKFSRNETCHFHYAPWKIVNPNPTILSQETATLPHFICYAQWKYKCYVYLWLYANQTPLFNSGPDSLSATWTCEQIVSKIDRGRAAPHPRTHTSRCL